MTSPNQKLRAAIYARYSSDLQSASSIDDQVRSCSKWASREGWTVVKVYTDKAVSGASMHRPGLQRLLEDCRLGGINIVLAEALDRISRDQEGVAAVYKRLTHEDVQLITRSEGAIDELHVGLKGTMNALFLKDLAMKTRRGLEGRVRQGRSGGGIAYGYTVRQDQASSGDGGRGDREINPAEVEVVRRIFREFATGISPLTIARKLNAEGIPGPGGRRWIDTTIRGHAERRTGILRNELYIGRLVWNRLRYVKDPETGRRVSRLNPPSEVIVSDVPHLRIVDEELWCLVESRLAAIRATPAVDKVRASRFWEHRRPTSVVTGRVNCGVCGHPLAAVGKDYLGCNRARRQDMCSNKKSVRRSTVEDVILEALEHQLMAPEHVDEFIKAFNSELVRERAAAKTGRAEAEREAKAIDTRIRKLVAAIEAGVRSSSVLETLNNLEARKLELKEYLASPDGNGAPMPCNLHDLYRKRTGDLRAALDDPRLRAEAVEIIRSLIEKILVHPADDGLELELVGEVAAMLELSRSPERKKAVPRGTALSVTERRAVQVVAGERNQLYLLLQAAA